MGIVMKQGALSDYFIGVGTKFLKGTEVDPIVSLGHELQCVDKFRAFLEMPPEKASIPITYVWISDEADPIPLMLDGTWYDVRRGKSNRSAEYRLCYPVASEEVVYQSRPGHRLFLCMPKEWPVVALFCPQNSSIEQQLLWLFGLEQTQSEDIEQIDLRAQQERPFDIAARYVLELINVDMVATEMACWVCSCRISKANFHQQRSSPHLHVSLCKISPTKYRRVREATPEKRNGPDFLFPGEAEYHHEP